MAYKRNIAELTYTDGHTIDDEGHLIPIHKSKRIVMNSGRRYYNCLYLLTGISKSARLLMDFLVEEMDENNIVYNNSAVREKFLNFIKLITSVNQELTDVVTYKDATVKDAFTQLSKAGLLLTIKKGIFKVHPEYFFSGKEEDRLGQIMKIEMEFNPTATNFKINRK